MKKINLLSIVFLLLVSISTQAFVKPANNDSNKKSEKEKGWVVLIDESMSKWKGKNGQDFMEKGWKVEDGVLFMEDRGGDILTKEKYDE